MRDREITVAGLYFEAPGAVPWDDDALIPVPLQLVNIQSDVKNFVAQVDMIQKYQNKENHQIEVVYNFPLEEGAAVIACSAELEGKKIVAKVQENKKAEKMYQEAMRSNKTAVMLSSSRPDIFQMKVGNLSPGATCEITISFIMELPVEEGKTRMTIPTTIAPRYIADKHHARSKVPKVLRNIIYKEETPAPMTFSCNIEMKTKILDVASPSHSIISTKEDDGYKAVVKFDGSMTDMDRDLIVLIDSDEPNQPKVVLEKAKDGSIVAMLSLVPKFELRKQPVECIFLLDCSGSMMGDSIKVAREALLVFLSSLPVDAHFNIVCFGSYFSKLFSESEALTDQSLEAAKSYVSQVDANFGGTDIYDPLADIFRQPKVCGKPRQVFVLTDGAVSNSAECISLVSSQARNNRVFTLGIGQSADRHLVKGMARAGMGTSVFTNYNENISGKVIKQLKDGLQPCIFDIELDWGADESAKDYCQAPNKVPPLYDGTRMLVYFLWGENTKLANNVKIIAKTPEGDLSESIKINTEDNIEGEMIHKMFARKMIQDLEERDDMEDQEGVDEVITDLGLKYGLASKNTSFIGVSEEVNKSKGESIVTRHVHNQVPDGRHHSHHMMHMMMNRMAPPGAAPGAPPGAPPGAAPPGAAPGAAPPMYRGGELNDSYMCAPGRESYRGPPPGSSAPDTSSDDDMECDSSWGGRSFAKKAPSTDMEKILHIANLQTAAGAFRIDKILEEMIGLTRVETFRNQSASKKIPLQEWWTALIVAFVELTFKDNKDTWELFVMKASDWLNNNQLVAEAKLIIQK